MNQKPSSIALSSMVVQAANLRRVATFAARHGLDPAEILRKVELDPEVVEVPQGLVPLPKAVAAYRTVALRLGDPLFGAHVALDASPSDYGLIGLVFANGPVLRTALETFAPLFTALIPVVDARFEDGGDRGRLTIRWRAHLPGLDLLRQDTITALVVQSRRAVGPFDPLAVAVGSEPVDASTLGPFFGVDVRTGVDRDEVVFPGEVLDRANPGADPVLMVHLREAAEAHVRRRRAASGQSSDLLRLVDCVVDLRTGVVSRSGALARLTERERALLAFLASRANQVVSHEEIERDVWGLDREVITYAPAVAIRRLRRKIERDEESPVHLETVFGEGWRLNVPTDAEV